MLEQCYRCAFIVLRRTAKKTNLQVSVTVFTCPLHSLFEPLSHGTEHKMLWLILWIAYILAKKRDKEQVNKLKKKQNLSLDCEIQIKQRE